MKLNSLNREAKGNLNIVQYLNIEKFSILLSIVAVVVCLIVQQEIRQLERVGKWLGLGFFSIGYMAQSIIVKFAGQAKKILEEDEDKNK